MAGHFWRVPRPETLYQIWLIGWAVGGAGLLWRSRNALKKATDGRVGWSGQPSGIAAFFAIYLLAMMTFAGVTAKVAEEAARFLPEVPGFRTVVIAVVFPSLMVAVLLTLRRYTPEFSPGRPHRVRPAGDFGFTPAGVTRAFAGAMFAVFVAAQIWDVVLTKAEAAGFDKLREKQESVMILARSSDARVVIPFFVGAVILAPIHEELFYRAGLFALLRQWMSRFGAYAACGVIFGAVHGNVAGFAPLAVFGAWLAFLYDTTADLRVPIVTHALFNLSTVVWLLLAPGAATM